MKYKVHCRLKRYILFFFLFSTCSLSYISARSQKNALYFYSSSSSGDPAVIKMTQDLLFSQLNALGTFVVYDRRDIEYSASELKRYEADGGLLFYARIYEENGQWFSELHLIEAATGKESILQNSYADYYKILMAAKNSLGNLVKQFNLENLQDSLKPAAVAAVSTESVSGTWYGEDHIDKIILLRGGRGFVIFKNGASMNIVVSINGKMLSAVQQSKPNASFFPEIPREEALINAPETEPIRWELTIENESTMRGVKLSLIAEHDSSGVLCVKRGSIPVHWHR